MLAPFPVLMFAIGIQHFTLKAVLMIMSVIIKSSFAKNI
jgi:hypothetical protein